MSQPAPRPETRPSLVTDSSPDRSEAEHVEASLDAVSDIVPQADDPTEIDYLAEREEATTPSAPSPVEGMTRAAAFADDDLSQATSEPVVGADVMMRDLADSQKLARRRRTIQIIWAIPAVLVLIAAIAAWMNRQAIVNRIPQMASVYQFLGSEVRAGGLEIDPPAATAVVLDGVPTIRVQGAVRNLTDDALPVPLIELTLHDSAGQGLTQWYVELGQGPLGGGERQVFTSEYPNPPEAAVGLRYRFVRNTG